MNQIQEKEKIIEQVKIIANSIIEASQNDLDNDQCDGEFSIGRRKGCISASEQILSVIESMEEK